MSTIKQIPVWTVIIVLVNFGCWSLFTYAQQEANKHMDPGPFFGFAIYLLTGVLLAITLYRNIDKRNNIQLASVILLCICLIVWAYIMQNLDCQHCANGG